MNEKASSRRQTVHNSQAETLSVADHQPPNEAKQFERITVTRLSRRPWRPPVESSSLDRGQRSTDGRFDTKDLIMVSNY